MDYQKTGQQVLRDLQTEKTGLSAREAEARLERYGPNALREGKKKGVVQVFLEQFKDLLVVILMAAAVISALSSNWESTLVIFAVLILNAMLGTIQYFKAEKSLESLKAMSAPLARVLRDGKRVEVPAAQIVPGDILVLEAGDMVAADGRILENFSLKVNESSLTGESEPVEKTADTLSGENIPLGDRKNMMYMGSTVVYGRGKAVITGTGMNTEMGKIADALANAKDEETPLQLKLNQLSKILTVLVVGICIVIFAVGLLRAAISPEGITGDTFLDSFMIAVSLAVAAIQMAASSSSFWASTSISAVWVVPLLVGDVKYRNSVGSCSIKCFLACASASSSQSYP